MGIYVAGVLDTRRNEGDFTCERTGLASVSYCKSYNLRTGRLAVTGWSLPARTISFQSFPAPRLAGQRGFVMRG